MNRWSLFFAVCFLIPSMSLFSAPREDSEEYLTQLERQLRADMDKVVKNQSRTEKLPVVETGKKPSIQDKPTGKGFYGQFTTISEKKHPLVEHYIKYYTSFGKRRLEDLLENFRDYYPVIKKYIIKEQLPLEAAIIPLAQSGAKRDITLDKKAGMWLLSEEIAQIYGLRMGVYLDERLDLEKSSSAALSYFSSLLKAFNNDWDFALTAFNGGGTVLQKETRDLKVDNFWDLFDKKSSISSDALEYVPKFYALLTILKNPSKYSIQFSPLRESSVSFSQIPLTKSGVAFKDIARLTGVNIEKISILNPHLSRQYTISGATLYIPANTQYLMKSRIRVAKATSLKHLSYSRGDGTSFTFRPYSSAGAKVSVAKKSSSSGSKQKSNYYRVKPNDTLYGIAKKTGSSVQTLLAQNKDLSMNGILKVGKLIKIAKSPATTKTTAKRATGTKSVATTTSNKRIRYTVKSGDTLYSIAKNYNVPISKVLSKNGASIRPGDELTILG